MTSPFDTPESYDAWLREQAKVVTIYGERSVEEASSYGPLTEEEKQAWGVENDPTRRSSAARLDDDELDLDREAGHPEPDDPDAVANGAVWTGRFWRPRERVAPTWSTRAPLCDQDFTMMEITEHGWICPDCGLIRIS